MPCAEMPLSPAAISTPPSKQKGLLMDKVNDISLKENHVAFFNNCHALSLHRCRDLVRSELHAAYIAAYIYPTRLSHGVPPSSNDLALTEVCVSNLQG